MSRDASGNYSLPGAVNPVSTGDTITATWANTTLNDLATETTDSLNRSGKGGMLAGLKAYAGTVSLPGYSWSDETSSGWYRKASNSFSFAVAGSEVLNIQAATTVFTSKPQYASAPTTGNDLVNKTYADLKGALAGATWTGTHDFTGATVTVATATAGDNDTSPASTAFVTASNVGSLWQIGNTATASASSTITFVNGTNSVVIDSTYEAYCFELIAVRPGTDGSNLLVHTDSDTGASYDSGASNYRGVNGAITGSGLAANSLAGTSIEVATSVGGSANENGVYGHIWFFKPSATAYLQVHWDLSFVSAAGTVVRALGAAERQSAADVDAFQFSYSAGTLVSGTIRLLGRKK